VSFVSLSFLLESLLYSYFYYFYYFSALLEIMVQYSHGVSTVLPDGNTYSYHQPSHIINRDIQTYLALPVLGSLISNTVYYSILGSLKCLTELQSLVRSVRDRLTKQPRQMPPRQMPPSRSRPYLYINDDTPSLCHLLYLNYSLLISNG